MVQVALRGVLEGVSWFVCVSFPASIAGAWAERVGSAAGSG